MTEDLNRHLAEMERRDAEDAFIERIVADNEAALARRLMRLRNWVTELLCNNDDAASDLVSALDAALEDSAYLSLARLLNAIKPRAEEKARELLAEAAEDYMRDPDPYLEPDAASIDLSEWE